MMPFIKRHVPLRTKLFILPLAIIFVMSTLCAGILYMEYSAATALTDSLERSHHYNQFDIAFTRFKTAFSLYSNSFDRKYLTDCYNQIDYMIEFTQQMSSDFPAEASIQENQRLVQEYTAFANSLIDRSATLSVNEFLSEIAQANVLSTQIEGLSEVVQLVYLQDIALKSDQSIELWQTQMQVSLVIVIVVLVVLLISANKIIQSIIPEYISKKT